MLATLTLAGLRVGELCALRWRDVDLGAGRLIVGDAKTDAGRRTVDLLPVLRDELDARKARLGRVKPEAFVFATAAGGPRDRHNIRERAVKRAAVLASVRLVDAGGAPLPKLTPHALRRAFASILVAAGRDPAFVMAQMGHTDPVLTLRVYAHVMRQAPAEREALRVLVDGVEWGRMGTNRRAEAHAA
jgi:integrase